MDLLLRDTAGNGIYAELAKGREMFLKLKIVRMRGKCNYVVLVWDSLWLEPHKLAIIKTKKV